MEFREHRQEDLITKMAPVAYIPSATCPRLLSFLDRISAGNQKLIDFVQRAVGYSMTGITTEQCLFFLYGTGANGKSTFLKVIQEIMGDYAQQADFTTFTAKKGDAIRNDLARMKGARFISAIETGDDKRFEEVLIKQITGGDRITARFLHQEFFEYTPTYKIWIAGNHKPVIRGTDDAIWRRIRLIPFTVKIPKNEQDPDLVEKLLEEKSGILNWMIAGCLQWQIQGLNPPVEVNQAVENYRSEMDPIAGFLESACVVNPNTKVRSSQLFEAYLKWCTKNNEESISQKSFRVRMQEKGFTNKRGHGGFYYWYGIGILDDIHKNG